MNLFLAFLVSLKNTTLESVLGILRKVEHNFSRLLDSGRRIVSCGLCTRTSASIQYHGKLKKKTQELLEQDSATLRLWNESDTNWATCTVHCTYPDKNLDTRCGAHIAFVSLWRVLWRSSSNAIVSVLSSSSVMSVHLQILESNTKSVVTCVCRSLYNMSQTHCSDYVKTHSSRLRGVGSFMRPVEERKRKTHWIRDDVPFDAYWAREEGPTRRTTHSKGTQATCRTVDDNTCTATI